LRNKLDLSQKDLGKLAGVSSWTVSQWETGRVSPGKEAKTALVGIRKLKKREAKKLLKGNEAEGGKG